MARRAMLRASDRDREVVAERLRQAAAEGRLLADELEHRVAAALRARTYGELDPLVADLPGDRGALQRRPGSLPVVAIVAPLVVGVVLLTVLALVVMVMSGLAAAWAVWLFVAWWFLHRGRRAAHRRSCAHVHFVHRRTLL